MFAPDAGRPADLSLPQFRTLIFLQFHPGASIFEVADCLGLALSTTSQLIDGLLRRVYISREIATGDRRRAIISLTEHGRTMLETVRVRAQAQIEDHLESLTEEERAAVVTAMAVLARVFRKSARVRG